MEKNSFLPLLVASSSIVPTTAQYNLQRMAPPKYAKPNGVHYKKVEGASGNLLVVQWHPQGRSMKIMGSLIPNE